MPQAPCEVDLLAGSGRCLQGGRTGYGSGSMRVLGHGSGSMGVRGSGSGSVGVRGSRDGSRVSSLPSLVRRRLLLSGRL